MRVVGGAIKAFNLELLRVFKEKGLSSFKAVFYKPFGSGLPIEDVIKTVEAIRV
jgi:hypothetical protein